MGSNTSTLRLTTSFPSEMESCFFFLKEWTTWIEFFKWKNPRKFLGLVKQTTLLLWNTKTFCLHREPWYTTLIFKINLLQKLESVQVSTLTFRSITKTLSEQSFLEDRIYIFYICCNSSFRQVPIFTTNIRAFLIFLYARDIWLCHILQKSVTARVIFSNVNLFLFKQYFMIRKGSGLDKTFYPFLLHCLKLVYHTEDLFSR